MPTLIGSDTFTDTRLTNLTAHTPSGGGSWATPVNAWQIGSTPFSTDNVAVSISNDGTISPAVYTAPVTTPADQSIQFSLISASGNHLAGGVVRYTDTSNFVFAIWNGYSGELELYSRISGTDTKRDNIAWTPSTQTATVSAIGSTVTFTVAGASRSLTWATGGALASGKTGLCATATGECATEFDTFNVYDEGSSTVAFRPYYITG